MNQAQRLEPVPPTLWEDRDEISLVDLGLMLWRRRLAVVATALAITALGLAAALLTPKKYGYTTTIELGTRVEDQKTVSIEPPETALAKVTEGYIPVTRHRHLDQHGDAEGSFEIEARLPRDSQLIILESEGREQDARVYRQLQQQVAEALIADHNRSFTVLRNGIELERQQAQRGLDALKDSEQVLRADIERLELSTELLHRQIADTNALIEAAVRNREQAVREANDEARAMTLLMLDNEVQQNRTRLAGLEEQLQVGMAQRRDALSNKVRENRRQQDARQAAIQRLDLRLENFRETRAVATGLQSIEPVGISRAVIAVLGAMLGGLCGLLLAFSLEFRDRLRAELAPSGAVTTQSSAFAPEPETVGTAER